MPALLNTKQTCPHPKAASTASAAATQAPQLPTSQRSAITFAPMALSSAAAAATVSSAATSKIATRIFAAAHRRPISSPNPDAPPVMTAAPEASSTEERDILADGPRRKLLKRNLHCAE
eukprot:SAG31_NODE_430_length_15792_cov_15.908558_10_plen_119_part_00